MQVSQSPAPFDVQTEQFDEHAKQASEVDDKLAAVVVKI